MGGMIGSSRLKCIMLEFSYSLAQARLIRHISPIFSKVTITTQHSIDLPETNTNYQ